MEGDKFTIFIHGPFATGIYLDAGKLSSIDDEFLREFARERKNEIKDYRKVSIPYMERIIDGIKVVLEDYEFPEDYEDDSNSTRYKFENNTIYFYECGTGLFSTQVTITFQAAENVASIASIKEAENFARNFVTKKFEDQLLSFTNMFSKTVSKKGIRQLTWIASDSVKVGRFAWLHTVYHICNPKISGDNGPFREKLKENKSTDSPLLLDQDPLEMSSSMDRYGFIPDFGSQKSTIVTKQTFLQEKIVRLVRLLETYQHFT
jgi:hypothetical protein